MGNSIIDLHTHSVYSDGELEPLKILDICHQKRISAVAITDHNAIEGSKIAILNNPYVDLTVIPGIEFEAKYELKHANLHILGYNMDLKNDVLNKLIATLRQDSIDKIQGLIDALERYKGISFTRRDTQAIFDRKGNVGRPEVAKLCVKYGYSKTVDEAFDTLLKSVDDMVPKKKHTPTAEECIYYIKQAGGIACLAHPLSLKKNEDDLKKYILSLKSYGLEAVEVYHSTHPKAFSDMLLEFTSQNGLLFSAGSDFHGKLVKPDIELGSGKNGNLNIEYASILTKIMEAT